MTLAELRTLVVQNEAFDLSNRYGQNPRNEDIRSLLNWAQRITSRKVKIYNPSVVFTLAADTDTYSLRDTAIVSKKVLRPLRVILNGNTLRDGNNSDYGLWDVGTLSAVRPNWRTMDSGTPTAAVWLGDASGKLILNPAPNSTIAAATNYIEGFVFADDLVDDTDEPEFPEELHEMLAYLAAYHGSLPNASEQEGWARLSAYKSEWMELVNEIRKDNENHLLGNKESGGWGVVYS